MKMHVNKKVQRSLDGSEAQKTRCLANEHHLIKWGSTNSCERFNRTAFRKKSNGHNGFLLRKSSTFPTRKQTFQLELHWLTNAAFSIVHVSSIVSYSSRIACTEQVSREKLSATAFLSLAMSVIPVLLAAFQFFYCFYS